MNEASQDLMLYRDAAERIKFAILQSRYQTVVSTNSELLKLYYSVGRFISVNTRLGKWGTNAIESISAQLQGELQGVRGFSPTNMKNMRYFYEQWAQALEPNRQLLTDEMTEDDIFLPIQTSVAAEAVFIDDKQLIRQLPTAELSIDMMEAFFRVSFTHHMEILRKCKQIDERWYYIQRCADEFWSASRLKDHLRADDYTTFGKMPSNFKLTIPNEQTAGRAIRSFKSEYMLDFLDISDPDDYTERDLEGAIASDIRKFIMTVGEGFCYIGNQYRLLVDDEEFFVDMLFFNRNLNCLVAFELKKDKFRPSDLGQLSFYLSALDRYVRKDNENMTVGVLLCQEMNRTVVELAVRDYEKPMGVATYRLGTGLPKPYEALAPLIDGVQMIIAKSKSKIDEN